MLRLNCLTNFLLPAAGQNRLNVLVKTLLLRRTKGQTCKEGKPLVGLLLGFDHQYMGLDGRKAVFWICKQQRHRLISVFIIRLLESIISRLATSEISFF